MRSVKAEQRSILCSISPVRRSVLERAGIDLTIQAPDLVMSRREALRGVSVPHALRKTLTSELAFRSDGLESLFGKEYVRRLGLLGLYRTQIRELYAQEKVLAAADTEYRTGRWCERTYFSPETTPGSLPPPATLTLSELLHLSLDATTFHGTYHSKVNREKYPVASRKAIGLAAAYVDGPERYLREFRCRTRALGWEREQQRLYRGNEGILIVELIDGRVEGRRPWTLQAA